MNAQVVSIHKKVEDISNAAMARRHDKQASNLSHYRAALVGMMTDLSKIDSVDILLIEQLRANLLDAHIEQKQAASNYRNQ